MSPRLDPKAFLQERGGCATQQVIVKLSGVTPVPAKIEEGAIYLVFSWILVTIGVLHAFYAATAESEQRKHRTTKLRTPS